MFDQNIVNHSSGYEVLKKWYFLSSQEWRIDNQFYLMIYLSSTHFSIQLSQGAIFSGDLHSMPLTILKEVIWTRQPIFGCLVHAKLEISGTEKSAAELVSFRIISPMLRWYCARIFYL